MIPAAAFLLGLAGFVLAVMLELYAAGMLFTGLSLGMIGAFLLARRGAR